MFIDIGGCSMSQEKIKRIHAIYGWILSCLIVLAGICFAVSCVAIYRSGETPFSRESVATHFQKIAIPVYLCLAGIVGGIVIALIFPLPQKREKAKLDPKTLLARLSDGFSLADCEADVRSKIEKERRARNALRIVVAALCVVCAAVALIYTLNPANYTLEALNHDILVAALVAFSAATIALAACYVAAFLEKASILRETELIKLAKGDRKKEKRTHHKKETLGFWKKHGILLIRLAVLAVGIAFVILGVLNGGATDVLGKAIRICTECIGLG